MIERQASPLRFFVLVFALSAPLWGLGAASRWQWLPGVPASAVMVACPMLAALVLLYRQGGRPAAAALLKRSFDHHRIMRKAWLVPALALMPALLLLSYAVMRLLDRPVPAPDFMAGSVPLLFAVFFVAALGEELGWSGYAIPPLQERWGALGASLVVGVVWAAWHIVPLHQAGRAAGWMAWWCLATVASRVLYTWLYNNTGASVFAVALLHASANTAWQLFPVQGSHYDPQVAGLVQAAAALLVMAVWGPRTLVRRSAASRMA